MIQNVLGYTNSNIIQKGILMNSDFTRHDHEVLIGKTSITVLLFILTTLLNEH